MENYHEWWAGNPNEEDITKEHLAVPRGMDMILSNMYEYVLTVVTVNTNPWPSSDFPRLIGATEDGPGPTFHTRS